MKYIKIILWIFFLSLIYAWGILGVANIHPELLFVFSVCYCLVQESFGKRIAIAIVCGLIMSALGGRSFVFCVLLNTYAVIAVNWIFSGRLKKYAGFMPVLIFIITLIYEGLFSTMVANVGHAGEVILYGSVYNAVCAFIIYPLVKLTFTKKERYIF